MTDHETLRSWPREKIASCVEFARDMGSITAGPLHSNTDKWSDETASIVVAASMVMGFRGMGFAVTGVTKKENK